MVFRPTEENAELKGGTSAMVATNAQTKEDNAQIFVMNNYFGIGLDADVCLAFHTQRER